MTTEREETIALMRRQLDVISANLPEVILRHVEDFIAAGVDPVALVDALHSATTALAAQTLGADRTAELLRRTAEAVEHAAASLDAERGHQRH